MNICIAGWYFNEDFYNTLYDHSRQHDIFVIAHRYPDIYKVHPGGVEIKGLLGHAYTNIGLEFGAYDQYLQNHWTGGNTLFIHDDTEIRDVGAIQQIANLGNRGIHQAFIFNNEWEEICNKGKHGRAIWCSGEFLRKLKADGGFPYAQNTGQLDGPHVNDGIEAFTRYVNLQPGSGNIAIVPGLFHGRRGQLPDGSYIYDRKTRDGAVLMPGSPNHCIVVTAGNINE